MLVAAAVATIGLAWSATPAQAEDCFNYAKDSKDKCEGHQQCKGTRKHGRELGCKITGTASCSTAANVKICSQIRAGQPRL